MRSDKYIETLDTKSLWCLKNLIENLVESIALTPEKKYQLKNLTATCDYTCLLLK